MSTSRTSTYALLGLLALLLGWLLWPRPGDAPEGGASSATGVTAPGPTAGVTAPPALDVQRAPLAAVSGTVRDPAGAPVAGARVCAAPATRALRGEDANRRSCADSGRDGHYRIEGLFGVRHRVHAGAPGFVPVTFSRGEGARRREFIDLRPGAELPGIDLVLETGGVEIHGVVEDLSGGPIEGAEVRYGGGRYAVGVAFATSGPDGSFSMWVRPGQVAVRAQADGYAEGGDAGPAPGHRFEVLLTPEAVLIGRVVRASDGSPVEGAEIRTEQGALAEFAAPVHTDADGAFRIGGLLPGAYKPTAESDDAYGVAAEQVLLGLGETSAPIVIRAHPAFHVEGTIVTDDGDTCDQGTLELTDPAHERSLRGATEQDGRVRLRGVLPGEYLVGVRCQGFIAAEQYPPIHVTDASVPGLRWEVARGRAIRGVVVDAGGRPVPRVELGARPEDDPARTGARALQARSQRADAQGRFELSGLLPGRHRLSATIHPGAGSRPDATLDVEVPEDRDVDGVRVELPAAGELRGVVQDTGGRGIARATLQAHGALDRQGVTADDGSFHLRDVPPGAYRVTVHRGAEQLRPANASEDDVQGEPVEVKAGAVTTLKLVVAQASGRIAGVVRDEAGGPLADAYVEATRESESAAATGSALQGSLVRRRPTRPVLSDTDGRFRVEGLGPGRYTLRAQRRGGGDGVLEHVDLGSDVVLTIAAVARLSGAVALRGGGVPEEFTVTLLRRDAGYRRSDRFFRTGGAFGFDELPPGEFEVEVDSPEGTGKSTLDLDPGEEKSGVRLELAGRVTARGTVVDLEGQPVVGVEVRISDSGGFKLGGLSSDRKHVTDEAGRFEVARAPTGAVTVLVSAADGESFPSTFIPMHLGGDGPVLDLPPLQVARPRTAPDGVPGDLGFALQQVPAGTDPKQTRHLVAVVRPGTPAAAAGLRVGDEVIAVDGHDVTGERGYLYRSLTAVPEGATIHLGLARGVTLAVTASGRP